MNAFLDGFASLIDYFVTQWQQILSLTIEHIEMTAIAVVSGVLFGGLMAACSGLFPEIYRE